MDQYRNYSKSHVYNSFFENIISGIQFFIFVHTFQWTSSELFLFQISVSKPIKTSEKDHSFLNIVLFKNLTHFTNLNSLFIEDNIRTKQGQNPFSLYKFSSKLVSAWCQKKNLHCTISWHPTTAFLKHFESKCILALYISVCLPGEIFVPKTYWDFTWWDGRKENAGKFPSRGSLSEPRKIFFNFSF